MEYDFEIEKIAKKINNSKAKKVCLQFPDGLKEKATEISKELEKKTNSEIFIWMGSNFGACDVPFFLEKYNFDLIVNYGHSKI